MHTNNQFTDIQTLKGVPADVIHSLEAFSENYNHTYLQMKKYLVIAKII